VEPLLAATAAFLATHFVSSTPLRGAAVRAIGEWPWRAAYSLVAFATLYWMIWEYNRAPYEPLWTGLRHLPSAVMPFVFILLVGGVARNPTAVGAEKLLESAEPARGMIRITRHPVMWAIMLWALAHALARGDVKSLIFFGGMFVLAALGTVAIDRKRASNPGWRKFAAVTSNIPFVAIAQGRNRIAWGEIGLLKPVIGLAVFAVVFAAHPWLFGARPY
jgi:uncharacterized membrane protein